MYPRLVVMVRLLLGADYLINGINWWFKLIKPYPSISDFVAHPPPPDIVGALIQTGFMFHIVKGTELVSGAALLTNRFVPLMLVVAFPVTLPIFLTDVFLGGSLRACIMGGGAFLMNVFLILAYLRLYEPLLGPRQVPDELASTPAATPLAALRRRLMLPLALLAALAGTTMVIWLAVMMAQYAHHPAPLGAH